jgi:hypothetical protein
MNETRTGWSGWIIFASVMLIIGGIVNAIYGMVAIVNDTWVVWNNQETMLVDFTAWGWMMFILGTVAVLAGLGLLTGNLAARITAVVLASVSLIGNFLFLPAFPLWALSVMVLDALVIYAVTAHGREMKPEYGEAEAVIDVRTAPVAGTAAPAGDRTRTPSR